MSSLEEWVMSNLLILWLILCKLWLNTSAIDPHHDGEIVWSGWGGHPHVEVQAVFTHLPVRVPHLATLEAGEWHVHILVAGVGVCNGFIHPCPWTLGLSTTETPLPYWWLSKRDAQESGDVAVVRHWQTHATDSTSTRLNDEVWIALRRAGREKERQEDDWGKKEKDGGLHDGVKDGLCGWSSDDDSLSNLGGQGLFCLPSALKTDKERKSKRGGEKCDYSKGVTENRLKEGGRNQMRKGQEARGSRKSGSVIKVDSQDWFRQFRPKSIF